MPSGGDSRATEAWFETYWNGVTEILNHDTMFTTTCHLKNTTYSFLIQRNNPLNFYTFILTGSRDSSNKDTILFKNFSIFCDLALNVLFCLLGQLDRDFLLCVAHLGLLLSLLLQSGGDGLVLPTNFMGQTSKQSELQCRRSEKGCLGAQHGKKKTTYSNAEIFLF